MNPSENTIGKRLRAIRRALHMDQKRFSIKMGLSSPYMSAFENDKHLPGIEFVCKLQRDFDVNPNYLLLGVGNMFLKETELSLERVPDYAVNEKEVRNFLFYFERSRIIQFQILSNFRSIMMSQKENIEKELNELEEMNKLR